MLPHENTPRHTHTVHVSRQPTVSSAGSLFRTSSRQHTHRHSHSHHKTPYLLRSPPRSCSFSALLCPFRPPISGPYPPLAHASSTPSSENRWKRSRFHHPASAPNLAAPFTHLLSSLRLIQPAHTHPTPAHTRLPVANLHLSGSRPSIHILPRRANTRLPGANLPLLVFIYICTSTSTAVMGYPQLQQLTQRKRG